MIAPTELTVLGSINVDLVATAPRLPRPGETVGDGVLGRQPGGKGANQAIAAARLGARVRLVGAVGEDADADAMVHHLEATGVDCAFVQRVPAPTGTAIVLVDAAGENEIVVCPGANDHVDIESLPDPSAPLLAQLEVPSALVWQAISRAEGFVALNAAPPALLPAQIVERVDLFIVNESEHTSMPELRGARRVVVTLGARGAAVYERGELTASAPGLVAAVQNTVGAGDAFCAAFTLATLAKLSDADALRLACRVGAAAVSHPDSQPPLDHLDEYRD